MIDLSDITDEEGRVILRALKRLRWEATTARRKNTHTNWTPGDGQTDVQDTTIKVIDNLLARANVQGGR